MPKHFTRLIIVITIGAFSFLGTAYRAAAQTYQIDCAILLCLSGGWPASVPCARARTEFIRRVTPWPVEPPLQIWRCPMGASFQPDSDMHSEPHLYDILFDGRGPLPQSFPDITPDYVFPPEPAVESLTQTTQAGRLADGFSARLVQDRADIDISGPEFNFVRSIRVYHVRFARQRESDYDQDCTRGAMVNLGTYGIQGEFSWQRSSPSALPDAHRGLEGWGEICPTIFHRSVFVDWRDFEGNYGFEQVNY